MIKVGDSVKTEIYCNACSSNLGIVVEVKEELITIKCCNPICSSHYFANACEEEIEKIEGEVK